MCCSRHGSGHNALCIPKCLRSEVSLPASSPELTLAGRCAQPDLIFNTLTTVVGDRTTSDANPGGLGWSWAIDPDVLSVLNWNFNYSDRHSAFDLTDPGEPENGDTHVNVFAKTKD